MEKRESKQKPGVQGEGNYDAAREYNERTRRFVKSGRVDGRGPRGQSEHAGRSRRAGAGGRSRQASR